MTSLCAPDLISVLVFVTRWQNLIGSPADTEQGMIAAAADGCCAIGCSQVNSAMRELTGYHKAPLLSVRIKYLRACSNGFVAAV